MRFFQPLPTPIAIWEELSLDFITSLPMMHGKAIIIVIMDWLSKYCHLGSMSMNYSAIIVVEFFVQQIVWLHGVPKSIISYYNKVFLRKFLQELFTKSGTTLKMSSAYHLKIDGQTEIVNKTIKQFQMVSIHDNLWHWVELLPWAKLLYNTSYHHSLGMTPFQMVYGRPPLLILDYQIVGAEDQVVTKSLYQSSSSPRPSEEVCWPKVALVRVWRGKLGFAKAHPYQNLVDCKLCQVE